MKVGDKLDDCEMPIFKNLANKAYARASSFGVQRAEHGTTKCEGAALYGNNSSVHLVYKSLVKREICNP